MGDQVKVIGLANGGGDCPGLNAVIRGVVRTAISEHGWQVIGIRNGFDGLIWPERTMALTLESVRGLIHRGGTILGTTNRGNPFKYPVEGGSPGEVKDYSTLCIENWKKLGLDAMIVVGGDGTLGIAREFSRRGLQVVGVPKTIDNDLCATEITFGFDTALHVTTDALDRLHTTAESHHRVMLVEVMGRDTGWIALHSGIAGGADVILIPEIPFTFENVCHAIETREKAGKEFSLVVVAEGVKIPAFAFGAPVVPSKGISSVSGVTVARVLAENLKKEVRLNVLGHLQRGGSPSPFDRILATRYACCAVDLVARGEFGRMVCLRAGRIESAPLDDAVGQIKRVDPACDHVRAARGVGITFGDRP
jgi:ATP-dependent phosphofructokinase / diphosphate-dependent phosphofructokinase